MSKKIIQCFAAQATGAFAIERDELLIVERPLNGEIVTRRPFDGKLNDLPAYLIDTALEVNTAGKRADLVITRTANGREHLHLVPIKNQI